MVNYLPPNLSQKYVLKFLIFNATQMKYVSIALWKQASAPYKIHLRAPFRLGICFIQDLSDRITMSLHSMMFIGQEARTALLIESNREEAALAQTKAAISGQWPFSQCNPLFQNICLGTHTHLLLEVFYGQLLQRSIIYSSSWSALYIRICKTGTNITNKTQNIHNNFVSKSKTTSRSTKKNRSLN